MMTGSGPKGAPAPSFPSVWEGVVSAVVEENDAVGFLMTLGQAIDRHFVPTRPHFQLLLYLVLQPPETLTHTPLSLLSTILSQHDPSSLSLLIPSLPSSSRARADPPWLAWDPRSELERRVRARMRVCVDEGIWGLLWEVEEGNGMRKGKEKEEVRKARFVSPLGWELAGWLVGLWEKNEATEGKGLGYSPMFLDQLPQREALQIDDASFPLALVNSAYRDSPAAVPLEEGRRRRSLAARVLRLLIDTALPTPPASPPFHAPSLLLTLIHLLRSIPLPHLRLLLTTLHSIPSHFLAHLYTHCIEDLGGVRVAKLSERRRRPMLGFQDGYALFPPPTVGYICEVLLPMQPRSDGGTDEEREEGRGKLDVLKLALLAGMMRDPGPEWTVDEQRVRTSLGEGEEAGAILALLMAVLKQ